MLNPRILWQPVELRSDFEAPFPLRSAPLEEIHERNPIVEMLRQTGVPLVEGATTPAEHALGYLSLAAEVEHALLVQYLYASISITGSQGATDDPRRKLLTIAIEEMGHLATVQNLLILVGGRNSLHLQRDVLRESSPVNPLPLLLEPVTHTSLAKYVMAERPAEVPSENLGEIVSRLEPEAEHAVGRSIPRVGAIYALLTWIFLPKDQADAWLPLSGLIALPPGLSHLKDEDLTALADIAPYEARREDWVSSDGQFILQAPHSCADAVACIDMIAAQGEGVGNTTRSHFERFIELVISQEAGQIIIATIAIAPTVATITEEYAHLWGEVFALQYQLVVLSILHSLYTARSADGNGLREGLNGVANAGMRTVLLPVAALLISLPQRTESSALAGPPFDLPRELLEFEPGVDLAPRHRALLARLASIYASIKVHPTFASRPDDGFTLSDLETFDQTRRDLFP